MNFLERWNTHLEEASKLEVSNSMGSYDHMASSTRMDHIPDSTTMHTYWVILEMNPLSKFIVHSQKDFNPLAELSHP